MAIDILFPLKYSQNQSYQILTSDVKSSNVMIVDGRSKIKLIDFGMAKHFDSSDAPLTDFESSASTVVGTVIPLKSLNTNLLRVSNLTYL
jgi:serine/threonine protein kinase